MNDTPEKPSHFIREMIAADLASGKHDSVRTRFPPEPNGYLHIGHAKSICLNFGVAEEFGGVCNLRYDDTNPVKEDQEYVDAIARDVKWLGFDWDGEPKFASDYFEQMYAFATELIEKGLAYVCTLTPEEFREYRGVPTRPGTPSPHRDRSVAENLDLFRRMKAGEFSDGTYVLRAKIDMDSPNLHLRDPAIYRIRHATHHRTGDTWCLYPIYDFAHCLEDAIERVTHSLCTLEFEVHRPLYNWILENVTLPKPLPEQTEFARLNITNTVMSKRKLLELVREGEVNGWDDPRMPTLVGMRRRGYPPAAIRAFCEKVGVTKFNGLTDFALLEFCVREELNRVAERRMAVLDPVKVVIENYPEDGEEFFEAVNNPENPEAGTRQVPFCRELYIDREDFMEDPPGKFRRLAPGREVRLRAACYITCQSVVKNDQGEIEEIRCVWDPESRGGGTPDGRKVKGTIHWVSARHALSAEVRLYDRLFTEAQPDAVEDKDFREFLNPESLQVVQAKLEPGLAGFPPETPVQFERVGYFTPDPDSRPDAPVWNRTATLRDGWKGKT
ncbi:MAG: glutamine--tRNA ligase/YqeY domain fusion protein [Verrucomicrobia bacterium]|nr:glutamine--tRNA ligase/YqeY domain fusion protein [Verrucomicrobiota bacterium]MCH8510456.1 glutamine--tRNA ligase/YqeY domain fusion protein [Kiritimatiellia bacterium]